MTYRIFLITLVFCFVANAKAVLATNDALSSAQNYWEQGQYYLALEEVNTVIKNKPSVSLQSRAYGMKGSLLFMMQHHTEAEQFLLKAFESADDDQRKAGYANSLGVLYHETGDAAQSKAFFKTALALLGNNPALSLKIKLNQVRSQSELAEISRFQTLFEEISTVESVNERTRFYINLAETAKSHGPQAYNLAQSALEKAQKDVLDIDNKNLQLEMLDILGEIYEKQGQDRQALDLSVQASALAGQMHVDDLMLKIEWRKGRIYQRQGQDDYALAAYGKAVDHIQAIRMDIPVSYEDGKSSFRETMEPIYLGYAHHLLKKADKLEGEAKQRTLRLARQTVEQIKQTELEDFLGGRCFIEGVQQSELDSIDHHAAIIYPIILSDRLELLVGIGDTVRQYSVSISENHVHRQATRIASSLRNPASMQDISFRPSAQALYRWIIAPIEQDLQAESIETLVFVPDGVLRLVPFAALFDGEKFLVEKYSVSISPGMSLLGSSRKASTQKTYRTLLAGLSVPGPVVEKLPATIINAILHPGSKNDQTSRGLPNERLRSIGNSETSFSLQDPEQLLEQEGAIQKIQAQLSLPGVETELGRLGAKLENTTLLNEQFTVNSIHQKLADEPYEIIHIASHGLFTSDADSSFLMAYDDLLKLDDLSSLLRKDTNAVGSIELLTLSACETAEGDDRAPLGFAGTALKADALSALGSLWPISDEAASLLMTTFYRNLTQNLGKAESLRQAQLELLNNPDMRHPFFWSPFILVGNWL